MVKWKTLVVPNNLNPHNYKEAKVVIGKWMAFCSTLSRTAISEFVVPCA